MAHNWFNFFSSGKIVCELETFEGWENKEKYWSEGALVGLGEIAEELRESWQHGNLIILNFQGEVIMKNKSSHKT